MPSLSELFVSFLDSLAGHFVLTACLLAVTGERAVRKRLKKLPLMLLSPLIAVLLSAALSAVPELGISHYFIISSAILLMCTLWVWRTWHFNLWQAFASVCMAGIFQTASAVPSFWVPDENAPIIAGIGLHLGVGIAISLLLYKLRFGRWFRLLLDDETAPWQTALLLFALEASMEIYLCLAGGLHPRYLPFYYMLAAVMVFLTTALIIHLAQRLDAVRRLQAQQDVIARQRLYEQDLEMIRLEVRAFRHDCKNLLAGLSRQGEAGEPNELCHALSELDAGFDRRLGKKIHMSAQIGNLQILEIRSLLLSKLTVMREKGVDCRLEVLYPVTAVDMDVWDFVRCLGILTDNALEAALETEHPWVEIVLLAQDRRVFLRVSNIYTNTIDSVKMWNDGWSTKGKGRGLGLSGYRHILENYPNASPCTSWTNGVFVQELTVEERP